ncbi:hypothetical protein NPIL_678581 [Nephila pilipes]|uniref:Uncharacterized protein n=1 Tax=Nephila pilipes TaxID=299642 RepID=A0A8X6M8X8_NEPPI|nr:hypothetical protein NPIL_678581 [Nephila pilipes]
MRSRYLSKRKPHDIKAVLIQIKNSEISVDDISENEDNIDYYSSQRELQRKLEREDDTANSSSDPDLDADPPSVYESSDIQHLETVE